MRAQLLTRKPTASVAVVPKQRAHAHLAPTLMGKPLVQAKLRIGPVDDPLEREADRVSDVVTGGGAVGPLGRTSSGAAQRMCAECEAEEQETLQRKCAACGHEGQLGMKPADAVGHGGRPLSAPARAYFEPRFGRDLSQVKVHTHDRAASAAAAINARAYTLGNDIAFAPGEYRPFSPTGQRLLAHELAHVVQQQGGASRAVRRTLNAATSRCPPNVHGAPADPLAELTADDERAQLMSLGSSHVLVLEALTFADPRFGRSYVFDAYQRRFGLAPAASRGRFRNRFTGRTHATQDEAMSEEMLSLSQRFEQLHRFLSGSIRYRCPGTSSITLAGCAPARCRTTSLAMSCPGGRQIAICPAFWPHPMMATVDQRGGNMIHEAVHMRFGFGPHGLANVNQRGRNAECHAAFVADVYNFQSDDTTDCTPLIP
jgi:hypothetical protein